MFWLFWFAVSGLYVLHMIMSDEFNSNELKDRVILFGVFLSGFLAPIIGPIVAWHYMITPLKEKCNEQEILNSDWGT